MEKQFLIQTAGEDVKNALGDTKEKKNRRQWRKKKEEGGKGR